MVAPRYAESKAGFVRNVTSFDDVFLALRPRLARRARHLTGNVHDAEDAVQDVYSRLAHGYRDRFARHPAPYAYAIHALRSVMVDARRRTREVAIGDAAEVGLLFEPSAGEVDTVVGDLVVDELLAHLTPTQRRAVFLVDIEGRTLEQAAGVLDVDRSAVCRARARGLRQLRIHLTAAD